jgi:hypothetical protein
MTDWSGTCVSGARNPDVVDKMVAVFENYWNSPDLNPTYVRSSARLGRERNDRNELLIGAFELQPQPFRERLLEELEVSRQLGHHRNCRRSDRDRQDGHGRARLCAPATATSAGDFVRSTSRGDLEESNHIRIALRDHSFGELWVGGNDPSRSNTFLHRYRACRRPAWLPFPRTTLMW